MPGSRMPSMLMFGPLSTSTLTGSTSSTASPHDGSGFFSLVSSSASRRETRLSTEERSSSSSSTAVSSSAASAWLLTMTSMREGPSSENPVSEDSIPVRLASASWTSSTLPGPKTTSMPPLPRCTMPRTPRVAVSWSVSTREGSSVLILKRVMHISLPVTFAFPPTASRTSFAIWSALLTVYQSLFRLAGPFGQERALRLHREKVYVRYCFAWFSSGRSAWLATVSGS